MRVPSLTSGCHEKSYDVMISSTSTVPFLKKAYEKKIEGDSRQRESESERERERERRLMRGITRGMVRIK